MSKISPTIKKTKRIASASNLKPFIKNSYSMTAQETLNLILEHHSPGQLVRSLPVEDFFWLLKKIDKEDCLPLLGLASEHQWQYVLDLEIWQKDRLSLQETSEWLERLLQADPQRLAKWLLNKSSSLAYHYLFNSVQIEIFENNETYDPKDDFFTLDGVFFIKIIDKEHRETIENILRILADENLIKYQGILTGIAGLIPAENEEEMYRLKNVRLAEHGFLPFEEAISVYAPLNTEFLTLGKAENRVGNLPYEEIRGLIPLSPLYHAMSKNILSETISSILDNILLERLQLEFAGLCNQIISADGLHINQFDILIRTCRKAAGYINIALEKTSNGDISQAADILKNNPLISVFRAGYGQAIELKREANQWIKDSWFYNNGLEFNFWGEEWGETIAGILKKRPKLFCGNSEEEDYRDFESLSEIDRCSNLIKKLKFLDNIFKDLGDIYPLDKDMIRARNLTFQPLLINLWARDLLKLEKGFSGLTLVQAKKFLNHLRVKEISPPYKMSGFKKAFTAFFLKYPHPDETVNSSVLKDTLSLIWNEFRDEFKWISTEELEDKFVNSIWIIPKKNLD
ncbi:MAG TPA: DUF6178 family protein [Desulfobacteraceae bacterium]|nr:DUF6178 family protein [Desulfobacteraceae bacterium]HPJ67847.1 DUF6178 family protein [Desulfobacteraceae bacterium]HPQ28151.1 DUF6178 family protein [Desulfobacteraceae bacterium]